MPGTHHRAAAKEKEKKETGTTVGGHNRVHSEAKRTGEMAMQLCTEDFDTLI